MPGLVGLVTRMPRARAEAELGRMLESIRHESPEAFYFAVEAKAILAVCPEVRRSDPRALGELVACGCVLENRTLFDGVGVMPSSSAWVFRRGTLEKKKSYFHSSEWEQQTI